MTAPNQSGFNDIKQPQGSYELLAPEKFFEEKATLHDKYEKYEGDLVSLFTNLEGSTTNKDPNYKVAVNYVKAILEDLVARTPKNVIDFFDEYIRRIHEKRFETYGIGNRFFPPFDEVYSRLIRSFTLGFEKIRDEHFEDLIPVNKNEDKDATEEKKENYYAQPEHIMEYDIDDDDYDEGGKYGKVVEYQEDFDHNEFDYNFLEHMKIFEDAGIGLPSYEHFEIHMALLKLAKKRKLQNLRFWGKIKGIYMDYYIAEADMYAPEYEVYDELEEDPDDMTDEEIPILPLEQEESQSEEEEEEEEELLPQGFEGKIYDQEVEGEVMYLETAYEPKYEDYGEDGVLGEVEEENKSHEESLQKKPYDISHFELEVDDGTIPLKKVSLATYRLPPLPEAPKQEVKLTPMEQGGEGVNKKIYFVCNDPKADWIRLPHVTPEQIVASKQIQKYFTGFLSARIISYPYFPGIEMNYLRAQIARISAGTQISPAGYYRFDEGEEAYDPDELAAGQGAIAINREFEPLSVKDLTDPSLAFWVHHTPHILNQGRTVWVNIDEPEPKEQEPEALEEELGEEEEEAPKDDVQVERGPPLLTSLAEDITLEGIPPWTVRPAFELAPGDACILVRSNLWPGSYSFSWGKRNGFIYIGWGLKFKPSGFTPNHPYLPGHEYPNGPEIMEIQDPTVAEEEDYKRALEEWYLKLHPPMQLLGEEALEEEGEEREDD